jgi:hypothetical protein
MSEGDKATSHTGYLNESLSDDIAIRLTRDPKAFETAMKHIHPFVGKQLKDEVHEVIQDRIKFQEKQTGHTLTSKQEKEIEREVRLEAKTADPHPSESIRERQAHTEGNQLGITTESFIERIDRKILEFMHLHGGKTTTPAADAAEKPDANLVSKPLSTPKAQFHDLTGGPYR